MTSEAYTELRIHFVYITYYYHITLAVFSRGVKPYAPAGITSLVQELCPEK